MTSPGCASSTRTPTCSRRPSPTTRTRSWPRRAPRASSASSSRPGTWPRAATAWPSRRRHGLPAAVGLHPHVASQADDAHVGGAPRAGRRARAWWPSGRPASTTTEPSRRALTSWPTCAVTSSWRWSSASRSSCTAAPSPGQRDAQDDLIRELREAGVGEGGLAGPLRRPAPGRAALVQRSASTTPRRPWRWDWPSPSAASSSARGEEASARGRAHRARRSACWSRRMPPTSSRAACAAAATSRATWPSRRPGSASCAARTPEAFGAALVAAFDRFVGVQPAERAAGGLTCEPRSTRSAAG